MPKTASVSLLVLLLIGAAAALYFRAMPERYPFSVGEVSSFDIVAQRSIVNHPSTEAAAKNARAAIGDIWVRSASISQDALDKLNQAIVVILEVRATLGDLNPETGQPVTSQELAGKLTDLLGRRIGITMTSENAVRLVSIEDASFTSIKSNAVSLASAILSEMADRTRIDFLIGQKTDELTTKTTYYKEDIGLVRVLLSIFLQPNAVLDQKATENARDSAYAAALANPVLIELGTYIVRKGELVTAGVYSQLSELDLLENGKFNAALFSGVLIQLLVVVAIGYIFLRNNAAEQMSYFGNRMTLFLALGIPFLVSIYVTRLSPLAPPVFFAAVVLCAYFGLRMSIVMSSLLAIAILPMTGYDVRTLLVSITGCYVAAMFARGIVRRDNYAYIIIATSVTCLASIVGYGIIFRTGWDTLVMDSTYAILSGSLSVIAAIGLLPVFEMLLNTVSPLRLIELSQTGNVLLRRLFIEAPGTSQHSMMVANLAESAAEAIGANPLLARVGAYYHDIGKLDNPHMFTENQQGGNPHDQLPAVQSSAIITAHPENGVRIGRKYKLPPMLLKIIHEHHGSTIQTYFYHKARKEYAAAGYPEPSPEEFRYHCPIPSSRESALVMLADSVEAAVKSTGASAINDAESLIRRIIKEKNDQDQLVASGLSYQDVEEVIQAFLQVYAGHFHERVKYPDDRNLRKPTAKISR